MSRINYIGWKYFYVRTTIENKQNKTEYGKMKRHLSFVSALGRHGGVLIRLPTKVINARTNAIFRLCVVFVSQLQLTHIIHS